MTEHHMPEKRWTALFDDLRCLLDRLEESLESTRCQEAAMTRAEFTASITSQESLMRFLCTTPAGLDTLPDDQFDACIKRCAQFQDRSATLMLAAVSHIVTYDILHRVQSLVHGVARAQMLREFEDQLGHIQCVLPEHTSTRRRP